MSYTTPLKVFQSMERIQEHEQEYSSVSSGDTLVVDSKYIIREAYSSENKSIILTVDGNVQADSDYTIDFKQNEIEYIGSDTGDATIQHKSGPYSSDTVEDKISAVEEKIDRTTNTTFEGLTKVTDERYDGGGSSQRIYVFDKRPVQTVSKVAVNRPAGPNSNPNYVRLNEGLGADYLKYKELGIRIRNSDKAPNKAPEKVQVTYEYGFEDLPADIQKAATDMVIDDLVRGTVSGAMVDGRDNFDPQTVDVNVRQYKETLESYRIEKFSSMTNLAVPGSES